MKEITAIIRMNMMNQTKKALTEAGVDAFFVHEVTGRGKGFVNPQLLPLWTGRAVNFVTSGSGWPFFHSPRGKSGMSHGLNR